MWGRRLMRFCGLLGLMSGLLGGWFRICSLWWGMGRLGLLGGILVRSSGFGLGMSCGGLILSVGVIGLLGMLSG